LERLTLLADAEYMLRSLALWCVEVGVGSLPELKQQWPKLVESNTFCYLLDATQQRLSRAIDILVATPARAGGPAAAAAAAAAAAEDLDVESLPASPGRPRGGSSSRCLVAPAPLELASTSVDLLEGLGGSSTMVRSFATEESATGSATNVHTMASESQHGGGLCGKANGAPPRRPRSLDGESVACGRARSSPPLSKPWASVRRAQRGINAMRCAPLLSAAGHSGGARPSLKQVSKPPVARSPPPLPTMQNGAQQRRLSGGVLTSSATRVVDAVDTSGDGLVDTVVLDSTGHGLQRLAVPISWRGAPLAPPHDRQATADELAAECANAIARGEAGIDLSGDGTVDAVALDTSGDGRPDTLVPVRTRSGF
jgi:hypothetical protein